MEIHGIKVNFEFLEKDYLRISKKLNLLEKEIFNIAKVEFNIGSPKQLGEILFEKMRLPFGKGEKVVIIRQT